MPTSVRPPDHARPQTGQATAQTRSADLPNLTLFTGPGGKNRPRRGHRKTKSRLHVRRKCLNGYRGDQALQPFLKITHPLDKNHALCTATIRFRVIHPALAALCGLHKMPTSIRSHFFSGYNHRIVRPKDANLCAKGIGVSQIELLILQLKQDELSINFRHTVHLLTGIFLLHSNILNGDTQINQSLEDEDR
ncbi:hypothetical protein EF902_26225 [Streptomyces sp. WAC05858]|nr:hypothetical protein EF902_26225 [Streptomyces sp. WAC05858]